MCVFFYFVGVRVENQIFGDLRIRDLEFLLNRFGWEGRRGCGGFGLVVEDFGEEMTRREGSGCRNVHVEGVQYEYSKAQMQ